MGVNDENVAARSRTYHGDGAAGRSDNKRLDFSTRLARCCNGSNGYDAVAHLQVQARAA